MKEILLIKISGNDRPGILGHLTYILSKYEVDILDIGQAVIHNNLALGMLVQIPPQSESAPIIKDLLFKAYTLDLKLSFTPISEEQYRSWVEAQGKKRHIITLIGRSITAPQMARITKSLTENGLNIDVITRLSGRPELDPTMPSTKRACIEFSVRGTPLDVTRLRKEFLQISAEMGIDIGFQEDNIFRRNRRLVVFDMDSTLIQAEVIDELAKGAGVGKEVSAITESAMRGELDFKASFKKRLALLKGLPESYLQEVANNLPLTEGAQRLISNLKRFGYKIAIVSGGFTYFGHYLQKMLDIDYVFANELEIKNGFVTGEIQGEVVDGAQKAKILRQIAEKENISLQQVVAVGDGANDLPMLSIAGLGIAFHAKPVVKQGAKHSISTLGLDGILYLIGVRDRETL